MTTNSGKPIGRWLDETQASVFVLLTQRTSREQEDLWAMLRRTTHFPGWLVRCSGPSYFAAAALLSFAVQTMRLLAGCFYGVLRDWPIIVNAWEQPLLRANGDPVAAQDLQQQGRQHHVPILATFIRGKNGRRYEVEFDDAPVRVEVHASEETVEIFVEADFETHPEERRRFAIINIPRHLFSEATGRTARRIAKDR